MIAAAVIGVFLLIGMSAIRQRSARDDQSSGGAPDTHSGPAGARPRGTSGSAATGEPASGERS